MRELKLILRFRIMPKKPQTPQEEPEEISITEILKELEEINRWFSSADVDLDQALDKLKRGKMLIRQCEDRLGEIENQFTEISGDTS